ncbi:TSUP family transporter, partial [Bacillus velezensis]|uniref:TSUP family transporter n=1 Tax=Bacillus velezensis TaxID=492670 RepID=UPI0014033173
MTIILVMLFIGAFGGFISCLVGIGGAIIIYPILLFIPPLLGLPEYSAYVASGLTAVQVFFSTLSGSIKAATRPDFTPSLVLQMGVGMIIGSTVGAICAN